MHTENDVPKFGADFIERLTELFRWRRDVRRFRTDPVDAAVVEELVALATLAPSVGHSQPWRFVAVESRERRERVTENFNQCNAQALAAYEGETAALYAQLKLAGLRQAPVHLAVFCDTATEVGHGLGRTTMPETLCYSVVGAIQNLALAARARGLGVGWVSILDPQRIAAILDVPGDWRLVAYLCIGYPQEEHLDPELERYRWQARLPREGLLLRR
ncbi:MAG TPA: 5,6-dimethylbenzimidazole synthase [Methylovirgula sp.]|nr:5,6-dimethylbenzimidazole synthase [Methylovirgula sp.]